MPTSATGRGMPATAVFGVASPDAPVDTQAGALFAALLGTAGGGGGPMTGEQPGAQGQEAPADLPKPDGPVPAAGRALTGAAPAHPLTGEQPLPRECPYAGAAPMPTPPPLVSAAPRPTAELPTGAPARPLPELVVDEALALAVAPGGPAPLPPGPTTPIPAALLAPRGAVPALPVSTARQEAVAQTQPRAERPAQPAEAPAPQPGNLATRLAQPALEPAPTAEANVQQASEPTTWQAPPVAPTATPDAAPEPLPEARPPAPEPGASLADRPALPSEPEPLPGSVRLRGIRGARIAVPLEDGTTVRARVDVRDDTVDVSLRGSRETGLVADQRVGELREALADRGLQLGDFEFTADPEQHGARGGARERTDGEAGDAQRREARSQHDQPRNGDERPTRGPYATIDEEGRGGLLNRRL